ncbi:T9SS type B sorting domain-containing protein [Seonamhaeicola sp. MEBiC1930]|uniref:T9SS type B sorting domain-containing protein n=1 Tax=Seonamhaeicola sp. MEBiC01930 TaxID=2976768 RepID=UPI003249C7AA
MLRNKYLPIFIVFLLIINPVNGYELLDTTCSKNEHINKIKHYNYAPPLCTGLTMPLDGDTNIAVSTGLSWTRVSNATGYKLNIGTAPGANNILNGFDVGNTANYQNSNKLPENTIVFVVITPYNADGDALNCNEESFTTGPDIPPPNCTTLLTPTPGAIDIGINPLFSWQPTNTASGYLISMGTNPGNTDILNNEDVGDVTNFTHMNDLPNGTTIYVEIIPYNLAGNAFGCQDFSFTTGAVDLRPECTTLTTPIPDSQDVPVDTNLTWEKIPEAVGYIITLETLTDNIDILNRFDVGDTDIYHPPGDLPGSTTMYVTITPYNIYGETENCLVQTFSTGLEDVYPPPKFFTPNGDGINDIWIVPNPINRIKYVCIFNRYGKLLKQLNDLSEGWNGTFNGIPLAKDDYWYNIVYNDGKNTTGYFSLVR